MIDAVRIPAPAAYAQTLAYSRLVSVENDAWISGCAPIDDDGALKGSGSPYLQSKACIANIETALEAAGFALGDVVRLRIYIRDFAHIEDIARAQRESFNPIRPACSVVAVAALATPGMLVYMDADARRAPQRAAT